MKFIQICALTIVLVIPMTSHAQVLFSEIAWMGTDENANDEWIELYNHGSEAVDVSGYTIDDGGSLLITLTGVISPRTIVVLERTDDSSVPSVTAFQIYTGALANEGKTLTLKDAGGSRVDSVVGGTDWGNIGGKNVTGEPKETPQQGMNGWVTGLPTPGRENVAHGSTGGQTTQTQTTSKSGGGGKKVVIVKKEQKQKLPGVLALEIQAPTVAYVNEPVHFEMIPNGVEPVIKNSLSYYWNFGDTNTETGKRSVHQYAYPGTYIIVGKSSYRKQIAHIRHEIEVLPVALTLARLSDGSVRMNNNGTQEIDISGYVLQGARRFTFPDMSFIKSNGSLIVPEKKIEKGNINLLDHSGSVVARLDSPLQIKQSHTSYVAPIRTPVTPVPKTDEKHTEQEVDKSVGLGTTTNEAIVIGKKDQIHDGDRGIVQRLFGKMGSFFGF